MATLHEITASNIAIVSDQEKVENLLEEYRIDCKYQLKDGTIQFYGYDGFRAWTKNPEGSDVRGKQRTKEFLHRLKDNLEDELVIHGIGHEKYRFPLCAYKFRVSPEAVYYNDLNQAEEEIEVEQ